jgi:hypothetical protein
VNGHRVGEHMHADAVVIHWAFGRDRSYQWIV